MYPQVLEVAKQLKTGEVRGSKNVTRLCLETIEGLMEQPDFQAQKENVVLALLLPGKPLAFNFLRAILKTNNPGKVKELVGFGFKYLEEAKDETTKHGLEMIREGDRIMTASRATNVVDLLQAAAKDKEFSVMVVESRPDKSGQTTAKELHDSGIKTTLICDAAVNYFMPEVDKVIVGGVAVTKLGLIDHVGVSTMAVCAEWNRVPFYPVVEYMKVSDRLIVDEKPADEICDHVPSRNPAYDFTRNSLITEYITDLGRFQAAKFYEIASQRVERLIP